MRMIIRARRVGATLLLAAVAALPAACSTVQSIDLTKDTAGIRSGSYLTYAVAKSVFTIQITAGGGGSSSGGGGGGKDKDKDKGSPPEVPAVPTSWTLSGTLTADGAKPASEPSKKAATDSSECGVMNHEYAAVQAEAAGVQETYGSLSMRLAQMIVGKPGDDDADKLSKGLLAYYQLVTGPHYRALVYRLDGATPSRAETMFRALIERCPPILSVQIQQAVLPDPSRTFALKQSTNIFYNDTMTFATDTNGFLTSGAPSSASQVTQIGSAIANDIGLLFPTGAGMVNVPPLSAAFVTPLDCKGAMPGDLKGQIEALGDCPDRASEIAALIAAHLTKPGAVAVCRPPRFP